ncbi:MAG: hypothetical protein ACP5D2_01580 [Candidatus Nanoarchaeia archaeon]
MKVIRMVGTCFILISIISSISNLTITGSVIGTSRLVGVIPLILFITGLIVLFISESLPQKINNIQYDPHALDNMKERGIFPSVVEEVLRHGEHYPLTHVVNPERTRGATDMYLIRDMCYRAGKGKLGERIIKVDKSKRKPRHVLALTDRNGVVKTVYTGNNKDLEAFLNNYTQAA